MLRRPEFLREKTSHEIGLFTNYTFSKYRPINVRVTAISSTSIANRIVQRVLGGVNGNPKWMKTEWTGCW